MKMLSTAFIYRFKIIKKTLNAADYKLSFATYSQTMSMPAIRFFQTDI